MDRELTEMRSAEAEPSKRAYEPPAVRSRTVFLADVFTTLDHGAFRRPKR